MPNAIANCNRLAACGNSAGNRLQPFRIHRLQLLRQRKQRRALPGGNHAEGYSGGAHRADVTRRGSSRLSRWLFPVLQQTSDDRPPMPGKSPPRRGGIYTNGERPFSISRSAKTYLNPDSYATPAWGHWLLNPLLPQEPRQWYRPRLSSPEIIESFVGDHYIVKVFEVFDDRLSGTIGLASPRTLGKPLQALFDFLGKTNSKHVRNLHHKYSSGILAYFRSYRILNTWPTRRPSA